MTAARPGIAVLMYHAIAADGGAPGADARYTIGRDAFTAHLRALRAQVGPARAARDVLADGEALCDGHAAATCITFDDGHATHYTEAFPALIDAGATADFFVNPARVGSAGHASWTQLREMADAGMSIQSHGLDHTYFTAQTQNGLELDLRRSKALIEDRIGHAVTLLAPPGGRMPPRLANLACALGYERVLSSEPGRWRDPDAIVLPRLAITDAVEVERVVRWALGEPASMRGDVLRYALLGAAKRGLGDSRYERLRARLMALRAGVAPAAQDRPA